MLLTNYIFYHIFEEELAFKYLREQKSIDQFMYILDYLRISERMNFLDESEINDLRFLIKPLTPEHWLKLEECIQNYLLFKND